MRHLPHPLTAACILVLLAGCAEQRPTPEFVSWLPDMPLVAAHRGGADLAPENTLQAFRAAQGPAIEAELIELDLHRAADGELVVIHDRTVDRVTGAGSGCSTLQDTEHETFGSLAVADLTLAELQELDAGACHDDGSERFPFRGTGVQIPSLRQVLEELLVELEQQVSEHTDICLVDVCVRRCCCDT